MNGRVASFNKGMETPPAGIEPALPVPETGALSTELRGQTAPWDEWIASGSNRRPLPCEGSALPTELATRIVTQPAGCNHRPYPKEPLYIADLRAPVKTKRPHFPVSESAHQCSGEAMLMVHGVPTPLLGNIINYFHFSVIFYFL